MRFKTLREAFFIVIYSVLAITLFSYFDLLVAKISIFFDICKDYADFLHPVGKLPIIYFPSISWTRLRR